VDSKCPKCIGARGGGGAGGGRGKKTRIVSLPFTLKSRYLQAKQEL